MAAQSGVFHDDAAGLAAPSARAGARWAAVFLGYAAVTVGFTLWLLSRQYLSETALWSWSETVSRLEAEQGSVLRVLGLYPQLQHALLAALSALPGLHSPMLPYLLSALTGAGLLTHFTWRLHRAGVPPLLQWLVPGLMLANPAFLWAASNGNGDMLSVALYYMLALGLFALRTSDHLRTYLSVGLLLTLLFLADARNVYLALALMPVVALVVQRQVQHEGLVAPQLILYTPLLFMIGIWLALSWFEHRQAPYFLDNPHAPLAERLSGEHLPWRAGIGRDFWSSSLSAFGLLVLCYPLFLLLLLSPLRAWRLFDVAMVLALATVLATGLAVAAEFTRSPADLLLLVLGGVMAMLIAGVLTPPLYGLVLAALLLGDVNTAALYSRFPATGMQPWIDALAGRDKAPARANDLALGLWAQRLDNLMIDESTGYGVIAARGSAQDLILSFSDRFQFDVNRGRLDVDWVAVPDPRLARGAQDRINQRFGSLYELGYPGYSLVYDHGDWRVYGRDELWPPNPFHPREPAPAPHKAKQP